jgi:hypothetical protein
MSLPGFPQPGAPVAPVFSGARRRSAAGVPSPARTPTVTAPGKPFPVKHLRRFPQMHSPYLTHQRVLSFQLGMN